MNGVQGLYFIAKTGEKMSEERKLTKKQRDFIFFYLEDGNGTRAAIRAGYPEKTAAQMASKLLHNSENVKEEIKAIQKQRRDALNIDENWSVLQLQDILQKCKEPVPVLEWDEEKHAYVNKGKYQFDSKGALGAIKQINELLGITSGEENKGTGVVIYNDFGGGQ